jgi:hypothetical protein
MSHFAFCNFSVNFSQYRILTRIDSPYFRRRFEIKPGERAVENIEVKRARTAVKIIFIFFLTEKKKREKGVIRAFVFLTEAHYQE